MVADPPGVVKRSGPGLLAVYRETWATFAKVICSRSAPTPPGNILMGEIRMTTIKEATSLVVVWILRELRGLPTRYQDDS
jgi:hypothetical protein